MHPGSAKDKMVNASLVAMEFNALLPDCTPSNTEGYEGFFHLCSVSGDETLCKMSYIIRDHDREKFEEKKEIFKECAETLNEKYRHTAASVEVSLRDQYYNMKEKIDPENMYLIDQAKEAFEKMASSRRQCRFAAVRMARSLASKGCRVRIFQPAAKITTVFMNI